MRTKVADLSLPSLTRFSIPRRVQHCTKLQSGRRASRRRTGASAHNMARTGFSCTVSDSGQPLSRHRTLTAHEAFDHLVGQRVLFVRVMVWNIVDRAGTRRSPPEGSNGPRCYLRQSWIAEEPVLDLERVEEQTSRNAEWENQHDVEFVSSLASKLAILTLFEACHTPAISSRL
jgi:hypothetical protein